MTLWPPSLDSFGSHSRLLHSPGRPSAGGRDPNREQGGVVAAIFVAGASGSVGRRVGWRRGEWIQVYNPCRVKTICIAAYSVMYNSKSGFTS